MTKKSGEVHSGCIDEFGWRDTVDSQTQDATIGDLSRGGTGDSCTRKEREYGRP